MRGETRGEQIRQKEKILEMKKDTRQNEERREDETLR